MKLIQIAEKDNVAVALHKVSKGEKLEVSGEVLTVQEDIPRGIK